MAEGDNAGKSLARLTQDGLAESSPVAADLISFGVGSDVLRSLGQINKGLAFNNIAEDSRFVGLKIEVIADEDPTITTERIYTPGRKITVNVERKSCNISIPENMNLAPIALVPNSRLQSFMKSVGGETPYGLTMLGAEKGAGFVWTTAAEDFSAFDNIDSLPFVVKYEISHLDANGARTADSMGARLTMKRYRVANQYNESLWDIKGFAYKGDRESLEPVLAALAELTNYNVMADPEVARYPSKPEE